VRTGSGGLAGAIAGVNDGLLASSQPDGAEGVDVSGRIPHDPAGDDVGGVVAVSDTPCRCRPWLVLLELVWR
jgi:hypothetical protein